MPIILFLWAFASFIQAQEPVLSMNAPSRVSAGQAFEVSYSINVRGSKSFQAPAFKGLDILFGPMQSQSSSFQFINGKQSQTFTLSFSYRLRAPKEGEYDFGKASIEVDGKTYYSESFHLKVTRAEADAQPTAQGNRQTPDGQNRPQAQVNKDDLYIQAIPNKRNPYVGEQLILTYRIYTAIPVEQFSIYKTPSNKGFWTEELKIDPQDQKQEIINGKNFIYADIRKVALFAQEPGTHKLEPMEVEAIAQVPARSQPRRSRSIFDFFEDDFFSPMETIKKNLYTPTLSIQAKPLPEEGKPASFDGLVGDYEISFNYDKSRSFKTNEAITFRFKVGGKGNIEMIHAPFIQFPPDFEVYEPKISHDKNVDGSGVSGNATFEYIVVPRNAGVYKIPSFSYSFFNPSTGKYEEEQVPETVLNIEQGKLSDKTPETGRNVRVSKNDIEYIRTNASSWKPVGKHFLFSLGFWGSLLGEIAIFVLIVLFLRKNRQKRADLAGQKNRKASREAKKCLKKAERYLKENKKDEFHIEISQALWGFLCNKLNIPTAELSMENVRNELEKKQLEKDLVEEFIQTLSHCEYARFAPKSQGENSMNALYDEAWKAIYKIVGALK